MLREVVNTWDALGKSWARKTHLSLFKCGQHHKQFIFFVLFFRWPDCADSKYKQRGHVRFIGLSVCISISRREGETEQTRKGEAGGGAGEVVLWIYTHDGWRKHARREALVTFFFRIRLHALVFADAFDITDNDRLKSNGRGLINCGKSRRMM